MPSQSEFYPGLQGNRDYTNPPRPRQRVSSSLNNTAPVSSTSSSAVRSRHLVSSNTTTPPNMRAVRNSIADQATIERNRYLRSTNRHNEITDPRDIQPADPFLDAWNPLSTASPTPQASYSPTSSSYSYNDSATSIYPRSTSHLQSRHMETINSITENLRDISIQMHNRGYQIPDELNGYLTSLSAASMTPSYASTSTSFSTRSTSAFRPLSSLSYCSMREECQSPSNVNLTLIDRAPIHKECLLGYVAEQILDESAKPNAIENFRSGAPFNWNKLVEAIYGAQHEQITNLSELSTIAVMFLSKEGLVENMRRDTPEEFIQFAFDAARALDGKEVINTGTIRLNKQRLLELGLEKALEIRRSSALPKLCKLLLETTNETRFIIQGRTMFRDTLKDWAAHNNLPRGVREVTRSDAEVEANMRNNRGSYSRQENAMNDANNRNILQRFELITSSYRPGRISQSRVFQVVREDLSNYMRRAIARAETNRRNQARQSRSRSANNTSTNILDLPFTPWSERPVRHAVLEGLRRAEAENQSTHRYNNESQQSALYKLMKYINSPDHTERKKEELLDSLCQSFRNIGTVDEETGGHVSECYIGQVGTIMQTPQIIDNIENTDEPDDTPLEAGTMDQRALNEMLRADMAKHVSCDREGPNLNDDETDFLAVQIQILIQDCLKDGADPDEDPEIKGALNLLRELFVENMKGKYCLGNTTASEQQVLDVINTIWPAEGLDPSSIIQPLSS
ncbi:MAG: hypothetical protein CMD81_04715 [Gammaproteobacteria bacterium]|nr:hypothetical protein [Gammaproteobacteria bacterium]HBF07124.1 hypothetical protein [Gammaproteobacteria bacterium]